MNIEELNQSKVPVVQIDKSLEKYREKVLFKDKLEQANEVLKKIGLPNLFEDEENKVDFKHG